MVLYRIFALLCLVFCAYCNLAITTGRIEPSGIIKGSKASFSVFMEIEILESYPLESEFLVAIFFAQTGFVRSTAWKRLSSLVTVNNQSYTNAIYGYDLPSGTVAGYMTLRPFAKHLRLSLQIYNLYYVDKQPAENEIFVVLATEDQDIIVQSRLVLPFHSYSYSAFGANEKTLTTRFGSALGFLSSGYLVFRFPRCVKVATNADSSCSLVKWISPGAAHTRRFVCSLSDSEMIVKNLEMTYKESKEIVLKFSMSFEGEQTCRGKDYVSVAVKEHNGNRVTENAVLEMGIYSLGIKMNAGGMLLILIIILII